MTEPSLQTLGRYTLRAEIGRGGFATVYQALDTSLNREVALKVLHPQMSVDRGFVERFRKEARTLASLRHPHIVTVYEVSEVEGRLFIAMELAHGPSLAQAVADRQRFPWMDTLAVLKPISEALDYAHDQGVVHRDLKPANVLLDAERGPLLTDFGFARLLGDSSASMSLSGGILGTPAYIAPEVWELDTATPAADIYALGCIAYEMLTGDVLFVGKTPMQSMRAHDHGPQFPTSWPADVPPGVDAALQVALARKPDNRYPSATTFWHALNDLEANAQVAREQAERQAVADQWKAEAEAAMTASEWSAAKMAVGRWLSITPDDPEAQAARQEIERQMQLEAEHQQKAEAERAAPVMLAAATARRAEEERARQEVERKAKEEADRKAREEQERQRHSELAAQAAAADKAKREAAVIVQQRRSVKRKFEISLAYPKLLSKRFSSVFLVQIFLPEMRGEVSATINRQFPGEQPTEYVQDSQLEIGQKVKIKIFCPEVVFSEPVVKKLDNGINDVRFIAKPHDDCYPGSHQCILSINDDKSAIEYKSMTFTVQVVDFAFDHVSRPLVSRAMSVILGIGSLTMFILTLLGQMDTTFGLASGTVVGAIASAIYLRFFSLFQQSKAANMP